MTWDEFLVTVFEMSVTNALSIQSSVFEKKGNGKPDQHGSAQISTSGWGSF